MFLDELKLGAACAYALRTSELAFPRQLCNLFLQATIRDELSVAPV